MRNFNESDFKGNPYVYKVDWYKLVLKASFRIQLYKLWKENGPVAVMEEMNRAKLGPEKVGGDYIESLIFSFKNSGYPFCRQKEAELEGLKENPLIASGKFYIANKGNGLKLRPEFEEELFALYPEVSVEEGLEKAGLDLIDVGVSRIKRIQKDFEERAQKLYLDLNQSRNVNPEAMENPDDYSNRDADKMQNPYIQGIKGRKLFLTDSFYNEAKPLEDLGISQLLKICRAAGKAP